MPMSMTMPDVAYTPPAIVSQASSAQEAMRWVAPAESDVPITYFLMNEAVPRLYWPFTPRSMEPQEKVIDVPAPRNIKLTRFAYMLGRDHAAATKQPPTTGLKTFCEAWERWVQVDHSARAWQASPFAPNAVFSWIDWLDTNLRASSKERVYTHYNLDWSATYFDASGAITCLPSHSASGLHLFAEPLARLMHTSRATSEEAKYMLKAYKAGRIDVGDDEKQTWEETLLQTRTLMDLLYVAYFTQKIADAEANGHSANNTAETLEHWTKRRAELTESVLANTRELRQRHPLVLEIVELNKDRDE